MADRYDTISFLSDYGLVDEFVGVVKSVIRAIAPEVRVIDITHDIAPHDVRAGALALARSAQYLAPGVVLAVVDPGVGTNRRPVAIAVGEGESVLVGPDNGLLASAVAMVGGATQSVELSNPDYRLPAPGATFDGRDVFAPAAAHLCSGVPLDALGEPVDPSSLQPGILPLTRPEGAGLAAEVLWVDRFGNAELNVDPDEVEAFGDRVRLRFADTSRVALVTRAYEDLAAGAVGLVVDSYGLLSVSLARRSAADELGLSAGDQVQLEPLDESEAGSDGATGTTSPVMLRARRAP